MNQFKTALKIIFICIPLFISCSSEETPEEIKISVNTGNITITIDENPKKDQKIGTVPGTTNKGSVTFSILEQTPSNSFYINTTTGEFYVKNESIYDYETNKAVTGKVKVSNGEISKVSSVIINIKDLVEDVYIGNVTLKTQKDVNEFGKNKYREIRGILKFQEKVLNTDIVTDPITDLSPLNTLEIVTKDLNLVSLSELKNLEGLNNLTTIGGYCSAFSNDKLEDISAFSNLTSVNGISIQFNPLIKTLECFSKIKNLESQCSIVENNSLSDLKGLENIVSIKEGLFIKQNKKLNNVFYLSSLQTTKHLSISSNPLLTNLNGLNKLERIEEGMSIIGNNALFDIDALENLTYIGGSKNYINSNSNLRSLNLKGLTSVNHLQIVFNSKLKDLDGLVNLTSIKDFLFVYSNNDLNNFCGLKKLLENTPSLDYRVSKNLYNPTKEEVVNGKCKI